ncbi:SDR family oxidoreductase [Azospirillum sp. BE72]|uniref:NAD-dependent epimerase/dehydratase family protein n=1 Tax=Azospirillum sp. BE72 TaxID=2817776 RepID=UPI0028639BB5|nr:SDR family oxidoreductase [Azospirillum sp. BE72]MDR6774205.1 nucleoside-diphosphate-sugar epimerase [Azospirillum sp. BE72]
MMQVAEIHTGQRSHPKAAMEKMPIRNVLIAGGAGYVGTLLTPQLLDAGYDVTVYDTMYYGCFLAPHPRLKIVQGDIRDTDNFRVSCEGVDAVIQLACISNDPSFELDEQLSTSINYDCFEPMVIAAKEQGVKRFIYASSSSVYGVSDAPDVTEEHPLVPLTLYNKFKGMCEPLLFKHQSPDFVCVTIRPATLCGYSPRMRLDLSVNILTNHAVNNGKITVFGGDQKRPNLHIQDMCDLYKLLLEAEDGEIAGQTFNAGYQNHTINEIAEFVRSVVEEEFPERAPIEIVRTPSNDPRSYHINSDKIARHLGFRPKRGIEDAARDLCRAFKAGLLPDSLKDERYINVKVLKSGASV